MTNVYLHEAIYRGPEAIARLGQLRITICGAGALGSCWPTIWLARVFEAGGR